ncbi:hypothetical protein BDM02DRAFT_3133451 [Thelephora ganbajun]|uniref:Uncharacterized protein n=1 Tax=Thelephora ganbajun TaxID=370292 RepID=A0ACB6YYI7_THEGA|nr:hypothetical protein BDM02DRAFT_3133451 [Thelephora ganbajun]
MSGLWSSWYYPQFPSALYTDLIWVAAMSSFKSNVAQGVAAPMGSDLTLTDLLTIGLVDWEGANFESKRPLDKRLLTRLKVIEGQVTTHTNALQLQSSGLDASINTQVEDRRTLLAKNAALEHEVEELKQTVTWLDGEFGVLLARVEVLEWVALSEYLSVEDLLGLGTGGVQEMEAEVASKMGLWPDFGPLVDRPNTVDLSEPLFPYSF